MSKIKFYTGLLISLLFLFLSLKNVDFNIVAQSLGRVELKYLLLCVLCYFLSLFCRAYLWKLILISEKKIRYVHSFEALTIGYMGNNVLPFRMGEAMRAYALGTAEGISRTLAFASVIIERLIDLMSLLLFLLLLIVMMSLEEWVIWSGIVVFGVLLVAAFSLYVLATDLFRLRSRLFQVILRFIPEGRRGSIERIIDSFIKGIKLIRSFDQVIRLVLLSLVVWGFWTAILYFGLKAFQLDLPITASLFISVVVNIGVMIPSSPGFIGVFQYLCVLSLSFFQVPKEVALSFSFLVHMVMYIPPTLLGWFYLTRMQLTSYQTLKERLEKVDTP